MAKLSSLCIAITLLSALTGSVVTTALTPVALQAEGQLAYTMADGSLWLTTATGEEKVRLTGPLGFAVADWSPDGETLALVKGGLPWAEGNEIHVVNPDGSGLRKVADGYAPVWTEDSQRILYVTDFVSSEEGTEQSVREVNLQDGSDNALATARWISGLWPIEKLWYSPEAGMMALYVAGLEMEGHVVILDTEGNVHWEISDYVYSADNFDWSPDGTYIVYRDSGDPFIGGKEPALKIFRVEAQELIASLPKAGFWPLWSPDGKKIATFLWQGEGDFSVSMLSADGGELAAQPDHTFGDIWYSRPYWSPDGSQLLVTSSAPGESRVYVVDDAGGLRVIAEGPRPEVSWSPDGTRVALAMGQEGSREVYVVNRDGSDLRKVADGSAPHWRPTVSPAQAAAPLCGLPTLGSVMALGLVILVSVSPQRGRRRVTAARDGGRTA